MSKHNTLYVVNKADEDKTERYNVLVYLGPYNEVSYVNFEVFNLIGINKGIIKGFYLFSFNCS